MDKQMIEEMAKDLCGIQTYSYIEIYPCRQEQSNEIVAEHLVRKGWIKHNENAVVLTKEEFEKYEHRQNQINVLLLNNKLLRKTLAEVRKETAKEILQEGKYCLSKSLQEWIKEHYGVEVE